MTAPKLLSAPRKPKNLYVIWLHDRKDWFRPSEDTNGIVVFTSAQKAKDRAAREYGYSYYGQAHKDNWVTVLRWL